MTRTGGPLRVALITNSVAVGGMEKHVVLLAKHLDREHFDVLAVAPDCAATEETNTNLAPARPAAFAMRTAPNLLTRSYSASGMAEVMCANAARWTTQSTPSRCFAQSILPRKSPTGTTSTAP